MSAALPSAGASARDHDRLAAGALDYGPVCPDCAGPKTRQALRCAACYRDRRLAGLYPDPPRMFGADNPQWKASGHTGHRATGRTSARPQPPDHPWRKAEALRLLKGRGHR